MMGYFVFFFVFIIAGVSFLRERISGTLDRILSTPIRRYQIVLGYFLGFGVDRTDPAVYGLCAGCRREGQLHAGPAGEPAACNGIACAGYIPFRICAQRDADVSVYSGGDCPTSGVLWHFLAARGTHMGADAVQNIPDDVWYAGTKRHHYARVWFLRYRIAVLAFFTVLFLVFNTLVLKKYRRL